MDRPRERGESPVVWTVAGLLIVVLVGFFDAVADPQFSFTLVYLAPLLLLAGRAHRVGGALVAGASAVAYFWAQLPPDPPVTAVLAGLWNSLTTLVVFLVIHELFYAYRQAKDEQLERDWIDPVTGAGNSKYLLAVVGHELSRARRSDRPFSVAYLDVTHLREVNETMGRAGGDTLLGLVANTIKRHVRHADVVTRPGGDEFVLLMPETDEEGAHVVVDRIVSTLQEILEHDGWPVSLTIGVATFNSVPESADEAVKRAEEAMYKAKEAGGARTEYVVCPAAAVAS